MIRTLPHAVLALSLTLAIPALAADPPSPDVPDCAKHLAEPAPGQVLTVDQLDANNACLFTMQQAKIVSDLRKGIIENDQSLKDHERDSAKAGSSAGAPPGMPMLPGSGPGLPAATQPATPTPPAPPPLPTIDTIMVDGGRATAGLRFANGDTQDVVRGSQLPDGSVVAGVGQHEVLVRRAGVTRPLFFTGDAPQPTQIIAVPGASGVFGSPAGLR